MRRIPRHRLALAIPAFFVVRIAYFTAFGVFNGYETAAILEALAIEVRQYTLATVLAVIVFWRPTGTGNLVALARMVLFEGLLSGRSSVDRRLCAIEGLGTVVGVIGAAGVAFFALLPGRYVNRSSLAEVAGVRSVLGLDANGFFALLVLGVGLWGLAWILEGVRLSTGPIYRQAD